MTRHRMPARALLRRAAFGIAAAVAAAMLSAAPAGAHAGVDSLTPKDGSTTSRAPASITLRFNEQVTFDQGNVQILDNLARPVVASVTSSLSGGRTVVTVTPARKIGRGPLVARWAVVSADGHPVSGAAAWQVGPSKPGRAVTVTAAPGSVRVQASSTSPGPVTLTVQTAARTGTVTLESSKLGAPLQWKLTGNGRTATASGVIPFTGTWTVKLSLRTSTFTDTAAAASLTIR